MPQEEDADVIDRLVGIEPGSALDAIRRRRPVAREQAQASYRALFAPENPGGVTATGAFRGGRLRRRPARRGGDRRVLRRAAWPPAGRRRNCAARSTRRSRRPGGKAPTAAYPAGPLSREDAAGPIYRVAAETRRALGPRLAAAFEHMHLLGVPPARRRAGGAAGVAGCRLVDDRHRDAVADRRLPVVPDPGRRRLARAGRRRLTREVPTMPDTVLEPPPHTVPAAFTRAHARLAALARTAGGRGADRAAPGRAWSMPRG